MVTPSHLIDPSHPMVPSHLNFLRYLIRYKLHLLVHTLGSAPLDKLLNQCQTLNFIRFCGTFIVVCESIVVGFPRCIITWILSLLTTILNLRKINEYKCVHQKFCCKSWWGEWMILTKIKSLWGFSFSKVL